MDSCRPSLDGSKGSAPPAPGSSCDGSSPPRCGVCLDSLGSNGGPASLPCGHNGCLDCLKQVLATEGTGSRAHQPGQQAPPPQCPFCRQQYQSGIPLSQNRELKDALEALQEARDTVASVQEEMQQQQMQHHQQLLHQHHTLLSAAGISNREVPSTVDGSPPLPSAAVKGAYPVVGQGMGGDPEDSTYSGREGTPVPVGSGGVLQGVLSLVKGRSRTRDQFWNQAGAHPPGAPASVPGLEGDDALYGRPGADYGVGDHSQVAPSAPPIAFSADPHYLGSGSSSLGARLGRLLPEEGLNAVQRVLEAEPPTWVPDSASPTCMRCSNLFRPVLCMRHHCRFCGHLVCDACSRGRALLPKLFREGEPQRVCDGCFEVLLPVQRMLVATVAPAVQLALHDVTDWSSARAWVNSPWGTCMQDEIFKATNTLRAYMQVGTLNPEKAIPGVVLGGARGLALLTTVKAGAGVSYKLGSGLVLSRRADGRWSAPTAIATAGFGWGAQIGGEIVDLIVVLRSVEALKAFCGDYHLAVGASVGAAAGPVGRILEADVRAGRQGLATAYTYSCAKGAYVGISWEYSLIVACHNVNMRFYGSRDCRPADILFGGFPQPVAAKPLYSALDALFQSLEDQRSQIQAGAGQRSNPGSEAVPQGQSQGQGQGQGYFEAGDPLPQGHGYLDAGDAMAAAEGVGGPGAGAGRFLGEGSERVAVGTVVGKGPRFETRGGTQQHMQMQMQGGPDEAVLGHPPPPYDACYPPHPEQGSMEDGSDEWPCDALPMMMTS